MAEYKKKKKKKNTSQVIIYFASIFNTRTNGNKREKSNLYRLKSIQPLFNLHQLKNY